MPDVVIYYAALIVTGALIYGGHYIQWPTRPNPDGKPSELPRILAYVYGVGAILAGLWVWLTAVGHLELWWNVVAFAVVAGVVTIGAYAYDEWRKAVVRSHIIQKLEDNERRQQ